jgi:hypothetical protein
VLSMRLAIRSVASCRSGFLIPMEIMPDEEPNLKIPAIVRAMIDPFRNIMGDSDKPSVQAEAPELAIERTLISRYSRPTDGQLRAIGRVVPTFSILERIIGFTLARLALSPDFPTMAITKEIGGPLQKNVSRN